MIIIEFENEEDTFLTEVLEWLSSKYNPYVARLKIQTTGLSINPFSRLVTDEQGKQIYLTAKEFDLLYFLSSHKGQVFTKEQLYEKVWGNEDIFNASNLTSFIRKLRKKIEPVPDKPRYIITVWGVGYKFSEEKP